MPEWPHNEIDKLFQEGSEKYNFEYNPEAWKQMDALLDKQDRRRAFWWIWRGLGIALLAALFSFFFFAKKNPGINTQSEKNTTSVLEGSPTKLQQKQTKALPKTDNNIQENGLGETIQQEQALPPGQGNGEEQDARFQQKPPSKKAVPDGATFPSETKTMELSDRPIAESGTPGGKTVPKTMDSGMEEKNLVSFENKGENGGLSMPSGKAAPLHVSPDHLPYPAILVFTLNDLPGLQLPLPLIDVGVDSGPKSNKPSLLAGMLGASEFNSVGFGDFSEMNWKFGLQLEYRFAKHFAVKAGASYIKMWYDAGAGEYIPEKGFWTGGVPPVSTRGQCNMLELPLLLNYYFNGHQNNGFFATAGVASYIILEEHYWYKYDTPPPDAVQYWGTQKDERDWLSIGQISGGYNFYFSKKYSIQVGPYLQFPLTGVGHGHVKIYSLGLNAVVNFKVK